MKQTYVALKHESPSQTSKGKMRHNWKGKRGGRESEEGVWAAAMRVGGI